MSGLVVEKLKEVTVLSYITVTLQWEILLEKS